MLHPRLDFSLSPIKIPERFQKVLYDHKRYPGAPGVRGVERGANCQQYAYEFVRALGFIIPDLRSSDLWADTVYTQYFKQPKRFDLVLVHNAPDPWGAHVGVYLGDDLVLHLSKKIGTPAIESIQSMMRQAQYGYLIGFKRILANGSSLCKNRFRASEPFSDSPPGLTSTDGRFANSTDSPSIQGNRPAYGQ
jgi:murein DD-endopeptidase / murein LD-carboxypeptidase